MIKDDKCNLDLPCMAGKRDKVIWCPHLMTLITFDFIRKETKNETKTKMKYKVMKVECWLIALYRH